MSRLSTTVLDAVPHADDSAFAERAAIFAMTQTAEDAVLRPGDAGAWSHALRHALAARIAAQNGLADLQVRYRAGAGDLAGLTDPAGPVPGDLEQVVAFMDSVAVAPRDVTESDVTGLRRAGVADADIVRLAELNACLAYQCRLIAGLRLLAEDAT